MSANLAIRLLVSRTSGQELFSYDATGFEQFEVGPALCSNGNGNGNIWLVRPKTIKKKDLWWRQELLSTGNLGSGFILAVIVQPQHKGPEHKGLEKIFLLITGLGGVDSDGIVLYQINDNGCLKEVNLPKKQLISDLGCIPTMLYRHLFSGDLGLWPMLTKLGADIWRFQGNTQSLTTGRINSSKTRKIIDDERARLLNEVILKLKVDIAWTTSEDVNQHIRSYQRKIQDEYDRIKRADQQRRAAASEPLVKRIK